jgi:hypothetical protein
MRSSRARNAHSSIAHCSRKFLSCPPVVSSPSAHSQRNHESVLDTSARIACHRVVCCVGTHSSHRLSQFTAGRLSPRPRRSARSRRSRWARSNVILARACDTHPQVRPRLAAFLALSRFTRTINVPVLSTGSAWIRRAGIGCEGFERAHTTGGSEGGPARNRWTLPWQRGSLQAHVSVRSIAGLPPAPQQQSKRC